MSKIQLPFDLSIIGTVGLPASYGGFETLAEQLVVRLSAKYKIRVFCSSKCNGELRNQPNYFYNAELEYIEWDANGWQSVPYDIVSLFRAAQDSKTLLVLGVSGCVVLPLIRLFWPRVHIVTNIDGVEWKRQKWGLSARVFLRFSEWMAVRFSHAIIADNQGICDHVKRYYNRECGLIAYGGDQAPHEKPEAGECLRDTSFEPGGYYFSVCRIEPENNIPAILDAFASSPGERLVLVGNWNSSAFAIQLRNRYALTPNIELTDPIYDQVRLKRLRTEAKGYIHGHSAGGTNPSLVEAMYAGAAILAFDVEYNRFTTGGMAHYWTDAADLAGHIRNLQTNDLKSNRNFMARYAQKNYTWDTITEKYQSVLFN